MEEKIYDLVVEKNEVTWQTIIYDLVKTGELNPWDVNIINLSQKYSQKLKELQEHNFFVSGKVILAAALLLRMKSDKLLNEHIAEFDQILYPPEEDLLEEAEEDYKHLLKQDAPPLLIKTPQSRKRQISLNELMKALEKALEVDERRRIRRLYEEPVIQEAVLPKKRYNISDLIERVYQKVVNMFTPKKKLMFHDLLENQTKEDKILTFIPLLHLTNQQKVDLHQEKPFGDIEVTLWDK